ncbi:S-adenosyl-L-methionine-dependent methyltransferase [Hyaloscypha hepaticicola]|uniref:S-adenosyl-L-methionine-dependent methyltransferase n=1 Tax=Hyaloscypha hepaticicola TaxID=2082293 RepID=A0A2J6PDA3_9HELO|nr:S-adenosyl-L-methionine-dependent methyltransferase [Hyaloscypha hepaticicola]
MFEAGNQDIMPGESAIAPHPGGAPATHEAEDAADVLDADADGPDVLDDGDSGFDTGENWTDSLASSIRNYRKAYGRTYHSFKEGKYNVPNDEKEQSRLDLQNHLFMLTLDGKLQLAPISKNIHNCLDVGTGTGIWATDFADAYPNAKVTGTDLSPIQTTWVPPNVEFLIDDAEEPWAFPEKFDFVHARQMVGSFASWPKFIEAAFEGINPGGWIELQDIGILASDDQDITQTGIDQWYRTVVKAFDVIGRGVQTAEHHAEMLKDAGFEEVHHEVFKWPLNTWPKDKKMKEIGLWSRENMLDCLEAWSIVPFTQFLGWSLEEVQVSQAKARASLRDTSIHAYWKIHVVYGRKPHGTADSAQA